MQRVESFPDEILRFLDANIESVDQLEILRILSERPQEEWTVSNLARKAQGTVAATDAHLIALKTRGLLTLIIRDGVMHARYGPATPELERLVTALLVSYREKPVSMIKYVYARAAESLRAFADAFKLRKEG